MKPAGSIRRFSTTVEEKEHFYQIELVKAGILHDQALRVAQILASRVPDEQLTPEENQIVGQACRQWLEHRKRWHSIVRITNKMEKLYQPPARADQGHLGTAVATKS